MLQRLFDLQGHGTTVRTEVFAGLTTFLTMAYIVVVNPLILGAAGLPVAGVAVATCARLCVYIGCCLLAADGGGCAPSDHPCPATVTVCGCRRWYRAVYRIH